MGFRWGKFFKSRWEYLGPKISNMRSQSFWWWWWCWCWWWCYVKCQRNKLETRWVWETQAGWPSIRYFHTWFINLKIVFQNNFYVKLSIQNRSKENCSGDQIQDGWCQKPTHTAYPHHLTDRASKRSLKHSLITGPANPLLLGTVLLGIYRIRDNGYLLANSS